MPHGCLTWRAFFVLVSILGAVSTDVHLFAQSPSTCADPPLSLDDIEYLLSNAVHPARVLQRVRSCGVTFIPSRGEAERLRKAGASAALMGALVPPTASSPGQVWTPLTDRRPMAWIPAGSFSMGSLSTEVGRDADEGPATVAIDQGFWMDTTEVTNEAYRRFLLDNPRWQKGRIEPTLHNGDYLRDWQGNDFPEGSDNMPVVYVSWHAARAYAGWAGKRLPTEAEWEYAARAGTTGVYWWSGAFDAAHANNGTARLPGTAEAARNPWGLYHTLGNVAEWVSSLYQPYPYRADDGREDETRGGNRVHRGGAWNQRDMFLRVANRNQLNPRIATDLLGFRCAR